MTQDELKMWVLTHLRFDMLASDGAWFRKNVWMRFEIPWMPLSVSFMSFSVSSSWRFRVVVGRRLLFQVIEWNRTYETWMDARVATKSTSENGKMDKHIHVARRIVVSRKCVGRPLASRQSSRIFKSFLFKTVLHLNKELNSFSLWIWVHEKNLDKFQTQKVSNGHRHMAFHHLDRLYRTFEDEILLFLWQRDWVPKRFIRSRHSFPITVIAITIRSNPTVMNCFALLKLEQVWVLFFDTWWVWE
jgi:hypothetical protein